MDEWRRRYGTQFGEAGGVEPGGQGHRDVGQRGRDRGRIPRGRVDCMKQRLSRLCRNGERTEPRLCRRRTLSPLRDRERVFPQRIARQPRDHERRERNLPLPTQRGSSRARGERAKGETIRGDGKRGEGGHRENVPG